MSTRGDSETPSWGAQAGETSWDRIARLRRWQDSLAAAITEGTAPAVHDARAAKVRMTDLAAMWKVTQAWIYTVAPARTTSDKSAD